MFGLARAPINAPHDEGSHQEGNYHRNQCGAVEVGLFRFGFQCLQSVPIPFRTRCQVVHWRTYNAEPIFLESGIFGKKLASLYRRICPWHTGSFPPSSPPRKGTGRSKRVVAHRAAARLPLPEPVGSRLSRGWQPRFSCSAMIIRRSSSPQISPSGESRRANEEYETAYRHNIVCTGGHLLLPPGLS
jgi:hypothetical protein